MRVFEKQGGGNGGSRGSDNRRSNSISNSDSGNSRSMGVAAIVIYEW